MKRKISPPPPLYIINLNKKYMIIYRQKMYGAFPASWGKELIGRAKKNRLNTVCYNGNPSEALELKEFRKSLKTADPLVNRQKYVKDTNESIKRLEQRGEKLLKKDMDTIRRAQMTGAEFKSNVFANPRARNATPINRDPQKWEKLVDKSREDNKNWRIEQARRDQEAKYQDAQKRIAKQDQQAQSQQKSKGGFGGFVSHVFGR